LAVNHLAFVAPRSGGEGDYGARGHYGPLRDREAARATHERRAIVVPIPKIRFQSTPL